MKLFAALLTLLLGMAAASAAQIVPVAQIGTSCHLPGWEEALRCVRVPVPLDPRQPGGEQLSLLAVVAPSYRQAAKADPLFVLAGGPGQAGSDVLPLLSQAFRKVRATRDIVFIDQRGTGRSGKLDCDNTPGQDSLPDDAATQQLRDCLGRIKKPFALYTTAAAAADLELVRLALGYGKVNLWGGSYGTRLGQAYARAYPASVRSLILDGVAAPDQIIPAGGHDGQVALDALFAACAADAACARAYPALRTEFAALVSRVGAGSVVVDGTDPRTAADLHLTMSSNRLIGTVHSMLYSPLDSRRLPFLIHSAYAGRWAPFVARSNLSSDFSADGEVAFGLYLAVTCAEDVPRLTPELLDGDAKGSFLTVPLIRRVTDLCSVLHVPAVPYTAPAVITAPVLMLSGALDPMTPPRRAAAAARYMNHAQQLVVANAGHGISTLGCAPRLMREFLDRPDGAVAGKCLDEIPAAAFQLGNAGPAP